MTNESWQAAEALERDLGDPRAEGPLSYRAALEADESELFPDAAWSRLLEHGYMQELIPIAQGGKLRDAERILLIGKVLSRRDLTIAVATGQGLLGSLPIWIGGSDALKARVASILREGGAGALALTEEAHGSDLTASEVRATRSPHGYELHGTKWAINNGTRGRFLTVLARTSDVPGPRALSLLLLDKTLAPSGSITPIPKLRTQGIRAADISGAILRGAPVPEHFVVGREGLGTELVMKTMQVSRTLCAAFSIGGADTALRLALSFARERRLYGDVALALPAVRHELVDAFTRLLLADTVAHAGARALSLAPGRMTIYSSVVKLLVPRLCVETIDRAATVLGARHYLRVGHFAPFQKIVRDAALIGLFDGSAAVNRFILGTQAAEVAWNLSQPRQSASVERARGVMNLDEPIPPFALDQLRVGTRGVDELLDGLDASIEEIARRDDCAPAEHERARALLAARDEWAEAVRAAARAKEDPQSVAGLARAEALGWLLAGAACVHLRAVAPRATIGVAVDGTFTTLALRLVLEQILPGSPLARRVPADDRAEARLLDMLLGLARDGRALSLAPVRLAGAGPDRAADGIREARRATHVVTGPA